MPLRLFTVIGPERPAHDIKFSSDLVGEILSGRCGGTIGSGESRDKFLDTL
jgi:hypothetical protein